MTHKEFFVWLDGFMTNRCWVTIKESDITSIQNKMKEVKDNQSKPVRIMPFEGIPVPVNPFPKTNDPYISPYEITCETKTQLND
jgi:hypothetical protein